MNAPDLHGRTLRLLTPRTAGHPMQCRRSQLTISWKRTISAEKAHASCVGRCRVCKNKCNSATAYAREASPECMGLSIPHVDAGPGDQHTRAQSYKAIVSSEASLLTCRCPVLVAKLVNEPMKEFRPLYRELTTSFGVHSTFRTK